MTIERSISSAILKMLNKYPVISLVGPRQSGKSTLLKHLLNDYDYVSLENPDVRDFVAEDPIGFLKQYSEKVIFDEVQRAPALFSYIQTIVDEKKMMGQFILSGSQNFLLLEKISQSLAGRVALFYLLPFSLKELSENYLLSNNLEEVIIRGFYPAIFDRDIPPQQYYPNYVETYIERDVRNLINIVDLSSFRNFVRLCAGRTGQLLNLSDLAVDAGVSQPTANKWLSVLEASFIIFKLNPFYKNLNKRIIKSSKLYFYDVGLAAYLLGIKETDQVNSHYMRGNLFETMLISDFIKQLYNADDRSRLWFYRDSNHNEVDCLKEEGDKLSLFEFKSGKTITAEFRKGIDVFRKGATEMVNRSYVVYGGDLNQSRNKVQYIPWKEVSQLMTIR